MEYLDTQGIITTVLDGGQVLGKLQPVKSGRNFTSQYNVKHGKRQKLENTEKSQISLNLESN